MEPHPDPCTLLCVGEVVWDLFPEGPCLGGAPFNVAVHLARLGFRTTLLTALGQDELGQAALAFLEREGIPGAQLHPEAPTGTVTVALDSRGEPTFAIQPRCAWMELDFGHPALPRAPTGVVFGGLAMHGPGNREGLARYLARAVPHWHLCDLNLRPGWADPEVVRWCLAHADVLKVNAEEWHVLRSQIGCEGDLPAWLAQTSLTAVCLTLGPEGLRWVGRDGTDLHLPAPVPCGGVVDTVGAGDAVTAGVASGLARSEAPAVFLQRSLQAAAEVCGHPGALPPRR